MEKSFWDNRYSQNVSVYGDEPNLFFKKFIDTHKPGRLLLPAEGEGRNAIYAALKGWQVDAFDFSDAAKEKALQRAAEKKVLLHYDIMNITDFKPLKQYDAIGLIYVHLPEGLRRVFHKKIYQSLAPGGYLILEAFAREQIQNMSGGPKNISLLYDAPGICNDFPFLHILSCGQKQIELNEGPFHKGKADILQLIGQKL